MVLKTFSPGCGVRASLMLFYNCAISIDSYTPINKIYSFVIFSLLFVNAVILLLKCLDLILYRSLPDASGGYHGFRVGTPPPQCVDDFSLPLCSQKY